MEPLVSIIIPAKNSARTIKRCLASINEQSYKNIETIIAYSSSADDTMRILQGSKCQIITTDSRLLGARYEGFKITSGKYVLMLDSDQILERTAIERSLILLRKNEMICLEEMSYNPRTLIEKLFEADRRLIHMESDIQTDPLYGTLHARFYRREIIMRAFELVPESLFPFVVAWEDAILNYEARKVSDNISILPNAIWHIEIDNITDLWKKNFGYGRNLKQLKKSGYYNELIKQKTHLRRTKAKISSDKILSSVLLLLKAPAFFIGVYF